MSENAIASSSQTTTSNSSPSRSPEPSAAAPTSAFAPQPNRQQSRRMVSSNPLARFGKWAIGYKEDAPDTISSSTYIKELADNPGEGVS